MQATEEQDSISRRRARAAVISKPLITADDIKSACRRAQELVAAAKTPKEQRAIRDKLREDHPEHKIFYKEYTVSAGFRKAPQRYQRAYLRRRSRRS